MSLLTKIEDKQPYHVSETASELTLTRAELAEFLFNEMGLNRQEAKRIIAGFFDLVLNTLKHGQSVKLPGFGKFQLRDKPARPGRNLKTGETVPIAARRVVVFYPSQKLKQQIE